MKWHDEYMRHTISSLFLYTYLVQCTRTHARAHRPYVNWWNSASFMSKKPICKSVNRCLPNNIGDQISVEITAFLHVIFAIYGRMHTHVKLPEAIQQLNFLRKATIWSKDKNTAYVVNFYDHTFFLLKNNPQKHFIASKHQKVKFNDFKEILFL